jgi:UDP-glucuronate 4-epimerase
MGDGRFLVTGSGGCIGAWAVARLVREGTDVLAFDLSEDAARLRLLLDDEELARVEHVQGDIRDRDALVALIGSHRITHVVHLAGLQVPFCKADPTLGSQVNVTGTINVFEAVRHSSRQVRGLSYASSVAVFGPAERYPEGVAHDDSALHPATLYGVYKQANEASAAVYAADRGVGSVGLRPCIVYGPGRDQGLTSDPTKAMLAAAAGVGGAIAFGGSSTFHHADDVAATFIEAARLESGQALLHNVPGPNHTMEEVASMIETAGGDGVRVSVGTDPLPLPGRIDGEPLARLLEGTVTHRPLAEGIAESVEHFRRLLAAGKLAPPL